MRAKDDPRLYETMFCSECGIPQEKENIFKKHEYKDVHTCIDCINEMVEQLEQEEEHERVSIWEERGFGSDYEYINFIK
jgi:hypothetical protein